MQKINLREEEDDDDEANLPCKIRYARDLRWHSLQCQRCSSRKWTLEEASHQLWRSQFEFSFYQDPRTTTTATTSSGWRNTIFLHFPYSSRGVDIDFHQNTNLAKLCGTRKNPFKWSGSMPRSIRHKWRPEMKFDWTENWFPNYLLQSAIRDHIQAWTRGNLVAIH